MINREDIIADMHSHTVFSLHAYSTIEENITYAQKNGMKYLAATDHYFQYEDRLNRKNAKSRVKFLEGNVNWLSEVKTISSVEFNILQNYDYRNDYRFLKWRPIGLHSSHLPELSGMTYDELYEGFVQAAEWNNAFNHIERDLDCLCYGSFTDGIIPEAKKFLEKIVLLAKEKNVLLEINENSLVREKYNDIFRFWMDIAAENGNRFYLGTDAHFCRQVGRFDISLGMLEHYGIEKDRVLNCNEEEIRQYLQ